MHVLFLGILELSVELVGRPDEEASGEGLGKAGEARIERRLPLLHARVLRRLPMLVLFRLADRHPMARRAGYAIACERAVVRQPTDRIARRIGHGVDHLAVERFARAGCRVTIDGELALALDAVAAQASVLIIGAGRVNAPSRWRVAQRTLVAAGQVIGSRSRCRKARC